MLAPRERRALLLAFPEISPQTLRPWVEATASPADARTPLERAAAAAEHHKSGLSMIRRWVVVARV